HINNHGLKQLCDDVNIQVNELRGEQTKLQKMLNNSSLQEELLAYQNSPLHNLREVIRELTDNYTALKTYLEKSPLELGVRIDEQRSGIPLTKVVEDDVDFDIFSWNEWRNLINNLNNGKINISKSEDKKEVDEFDKIFGGGSQVSIPPTKSDDFYEIFAETVKKLEQDTREKIDKAIEDFLKELSNETVSVQGNHTTINLPDLRKRLIKCLPSSQIDNLLDVASNPMAKLWEDKIKASIKDRKLPEIEPKDIFPLACEDKDKNKPGQKFIWDPDRSHINTGQENHQITMLQLRDAMIVSLTQKLVELVHEANKLVNEQLITEVLNKIISRLGDLSRNNQQLRSIVYGDSQPDNSIPDWLESLNKLSSIEHPQLKM
ncbi:MAG: hypothetical protein WBA41_30080, partial [Rivularia sp. (in: cyanobacteria)]